MATDAGHPTRPTLGSPGGAVRELRRPAGRRPALLPGVRGAARARRAWPSARSSPRGGAPPPRRPRAVAAPAQRRRRPRAAGSRSWAGWLCLLLALGVGVLIGNSGDDGTPATARRRRRSSRVGGAAAAPAATAPRRRRARRPPRRSAGASSVVGEVEQGRGLRRAQALQAARRPTTRRSRTSTPARARTTRRSPRSCPRRSGPAASRRPRTTSPPAAARTSRTSDERADRSPARPPRGAQAAPAAAPRLQAHAELRARRDALAEEVAELTWDLGGLTYEMAIRDHFRLDVLIRRAAALQERDAELGEVERLPRRRRRGRRRRLSLVRRPPQPRRRLLLEVRPAADAPGDERGVDRADGQRQRIALRLAGGAARARHRGEAAGGASAGGAFIGIVLTNGGSWPEKSARS